VTFVNICLAASALVLGSTASVLASVSKATASASVSNPGASALALVSGYTALVTTLSRIREGATRGNSSLWAGFLNIFIRSIMKNVKKMGFKSGVKTE